MGDPNGDEVFGAGRELVRDLARPRVELSIRERLPFVGDRDGVRSARHGPGEEGGQRRDGRLRLPTSLPIGEEQRPFFRGEPVGRPIRRDALEHTNEAAGDTLHALAIENVDGVFEAQLAIAHLEREIVLHRMAPRGQVLERDALARHGPDGEVLEREDRLKNRCFLRIALDAERRDELLERKILVLERGEDLRADPPEDGLERRMAADIDAKSDRVHEHADDAFEIGMRAPEDGGADREVRLTRERREQDPIGRRHDHEEGRALLLPQRVEPIA